MSTVRVARPVSTHHTIESDKDRARFLRRVLRESGWTMRALASEDWQICFTRTIKAKYPGDADIDVNVRLKDKISLVGRWGNQQSFSDSEIVNVPKPTRAWLHYGSVRTAARFLLDGSQLMACGSSGSTSSSKHGLAFVSLNALTKGGSDQVQIGHQSVYVHGRMVCCGSVE